MPRMPNLFIASSSENLDAAYAIQELLERVATCTLWAHGFFRLSKSRLSELESALKSMDFGIFVFLPDDVTSIRDEELETVRDNVVFELGLFMGGLGSERTFIVAPAGVERFRLPSDLAGLVTATVTLNGGPLETQLGPTCNQIRRRIGALGPIGRQQGVMLSARTEGPGDIKELIAAARSEILAVGPTLAYLAQYLERYLFERAREGVAIKLLTMRHAPEPVRLVAQMTRGRGFSDQLEIAHRAFARWLDDDDTGKVEVRLTDIVPYSITIIDGQSLEGKLMLVPTQYRGFGIDRPCLLIEREVHSKAFDLYYDATKLWWDDSVPISARASGPLVPGPVVLGDASNT